MSKRHRKSPSDAARRLEPIASSSTRVEDLCEGIIEAGWLLSLALVPLFFNIFSARSYEPDKIAVLRSLVLVMVAAWLWKVGSGGRAFRPTTGDPDDISEGSLSLLTLVRHLARQPLVPLTALLAASLVIGSLLSIDPRLSWQGSYPRFQGAWTQLSYLAVFGLTAAHLRSREQWRRVVFVVLLTSVPVSIYALFQAAGLDPLQHAMSVRRAFSTLGNPIFLGAYLLMVFFITLLEAGRAAVRFWRRRRLAHALSTVTMALVGVLQGTALVLTQSRGPFLGLLAGAYVFFLVLALVGRTRALAFPPRSPLLSRALRWMWAVIIGLALLGAGFLIVLNSPNSGLAPLKRTPTVGRLGSVLDFESNSVQVRLLIWDGVIDLLASDEPLVAPDSTPDRLAAVRTLMGYGPETMPLAINRFISPELGQREGRSDIPDRSHNETFDVLIMQGALGYAIWLAIYCSAFLLALRQLGLVRSRPQRLSFWLNLSLGAALGALGPYFLLGRWTLSGVGLPAGLITGLVVFVTLEALIGGRSVAVGNRLADTGLIVALLATFIAHMAEVHFGIAIVSTRLYFWFFLAVLLAASNGWLARPESEISSPDRSGGSKRGEEESAFSEGRGASSSPPLAGVLAGLLVVGVCAPLTYGMVLNPARLTGAVEVLAGSLWGTSAGTWLGASALLWLLVLTVAAAVALAVPGGHDSERTGLRVQLLQLVLLGGVGSLAQALLQAGFVARGSRPGTSGSDPLEGSFASLGAISGFVVLMILLVVAIGLVLGWRRGDLRSWSRRPTTVSAAVGTILALASAWLIDSFNLDQIRADTLLKQGRTFVAAGRPDLGLRLLDRACELSPKEPMFFLSRAQVALQAAAGARVPEARTELLEATEKTLLQARDLAPLDPDHSANLARFYARRAAGASDSNDKKQLRQQAEAEYRATLALRPRSVLFINELAPLLVETERLEEAEALLRRALELDDRYGRTLFNMGTVHQTRAAAAGRVRDLQSFVDALERAIAWHERALLLDPKLAVAEKELERLRPALESIPRPSLTPTKLKELYGADARVHLDLARLHLGSGRAGDALRHARVVAEVAAADQRAEASDLLAEVQAAVEQQQ
jgi:tetratricopeptide (TPR) repeat protein